MKTIADLRRDLSIGTQVTLTYAQFTHKFLNVPRVVIKLQSNGVVLALSATDTKGSFLDFPKASLASYTIDGDLNIYEAGTRPLTPAEQRVFDTMPSKLPEYQQQVSDDMMTDGSQMFYKDRRHTKDNKMEYLDGFDTIRGLRYDHNTKLIIDETIKGKLSLSYKIK